MYFDSHAHYDDQRYNEDVNNLLIKMNEEDKVDHIINVSCDFPSMETTLELCEKFSFVYGALGTHPHSAKNVTNNHYDFIRRHSKNKKIVSIGETGLDYYYNYSEKQKQIEEFHNHLDLASELNLPVIIHERDAKKDTLDVISSHNNQGVFHCFSGSVEIAKIVLDKGYYIALGGVVTFKNSKQAKEVAAYVPSDRLLIETDCPYLTPEPFRGKRNQSSYLSYIAEAIGNIRGVSKEEIGKITSNNAKRLFLKDELL